MTSPRILLAAALFIFMPTVSDAATSAVVRSIEGTVEVRANASGWRAAVAGEKLGAGASVRTGLGSRCILDVDAAQQGANVKLEPGTLAEIASLEPVRVNLTSGKLYALVSKLSKGSTFEVKTPTAMASVRGTGWGQSPDHVDVFDGTVNVKGENGEELDIPEGSGVDTEGGDLGDLKDVSEDEKEKFETFEEQVESDGDEEGGGKEGPEETFGDPFEDPFETADPGLTDAKDLSQDVDRQEDFKSEMLDQKDDDNSDDGRDSGDNGINNS